LSAALRQRGFRFVGSTICYAFMQATGMVNDHLVSCDRYGEIGGIGRNPR
jgi:DNA-3-methyladenine glycosylase I